MLCFLNKRYQTWTTYKSNYINMQRIMIAKVVDNKLQTDMQKTWNKSLIYWKRNLLQDISSRLILYQKSIAWFSHKWRWSLLPKSKKYLKTSHRVKHPCGNCQNSLQKSLNNLPKSLILPMTNNWKPYLNYCSMSNWLMKFMGTYK